MKKLYIDTDGVLLTIKNTQRPQYAVEFIDYITSAFDCYWLTSHCKEGNNLHLLQYLSPYYDDKTIDKLKKIKPTSWVNAKVEAIDIHSDFYWLDDYPHRSFSISSKRSNSARYWAASINSSFLAASCICLRARSMAFSI